MFQIRPLSINYLGFDTGYKFFVNIADVNSLIYGTKNLNYVNVLPIGQFAQYNGTYDNLLNTVENFGATGENSYLTEFLFPLQSAFTINESSSVFLKIPKIPAGASSENANERNVFFIARADVADVDTFFWKDQFEIVTQVKKNDIDIVQKYDVFQNVTNVIDFPIEDEGEQEGYLYIKLADITIQNNKPRIRQFFQSNIFTPNRYLTMGLNYNRATVVHFLGKEIYGSEENGDYSIIETDYSRPNWIIKSNTEIFSTAVQTIRDDFTNFYNNWNSNSAGLSLPIVDFDVIQAFCIYIQNANEKIRVKKLFESESDEDLYVPLTQENLTAVIPELNSSNAIVEL